MRFLVFIDTGVELSANATINNYCTSAGANLSVLSLKNKVTLEYIVEPGQHSGFSLKYAVGK